MHQPQYSLRSLFIVATLACIGCALSHHFGIPFGIGVVVGVSLFLLWGFFSHLAPDATKYFTAFGLIGFFSISLTAMCLLRIREGARRNQTHSNLQQLGHEYQQKADHFPASRVGQNR